MWVPTNITALFAGGLGVVGAAFLIKDFMCGDQYDKKRRADGKVVVVTGANTGMGRQAALEFANRGAKVFMACRNMKKCETARKDIVLTSENKFVYCRPCDLASQESIRKFVERFKQEEPHLHILVNNAAVMGGERHVTREGIEYQLGVNHMGHFLLTNLLLPLLKKSAPSRIVVMSSHAHRHAKIDKDDLNMTKNYDPEIAYNNSKLANLLFSNLLALKLLGSGVTVNALHPGLVKTTLDRNTPMAQSWTRHFIRPLFWFVTKSPRIGAQAIVHAALDPALDDLSGDYLVDHNVSAQSELAQDMELAHWLWLVSEKWTRLEQQNVEIGK